MNFQVNNVLILTFIVLFFMFYIISQHKVERRNPVKLKDVVRPSYGDEFYNYSGGDRVRYINQETTEDKERAIYKETNLIEGFTNTVSNKDIISNHQTCPETGGDTNYTSCIHYPNKVIQGLDEVIDYGFLISVSNKDSLNKIQSSLETGQGEYDLIYEDNQIGLTKNNRNVQLLVDCNATNLFKVTQLVGTTTV